MGICHTCRLLMVARSSSRHCLYPFPTVTTANVTNITQTTSGGKVTSGCGGTPVTARGCAGSSCPAPLATSHTTDGSGTGAFTSSLAGTYSNTVFIMSVPMLQTLRGLREPGSFATLTIVAGSTGYQYHPDNSTVGM